jgi:oligo-1,6-glucosidase
VRAYRPTHPEYHGAVAARWAASTVYQIYPRSFADANGDGFGDLRGILGRVDYLARLGIDVVWLSPIQPSPDVDNGYDISDYEGVDPRYGSLADFDELLAALHARDIKLIMDLVVNHTSDQHAWFAASRSSRSDPKRDWYFWRPARPGTKPGAPGAEPNNWGSFFSGPAWRFDPETGEYYLHVFAAEQPDLNWENPDLRAAIYTMMRGWLDRGVDGFRMDVINMISKDPSLPDGPTIAGLRYGLGVPHFVGGPRLHDHLAEMRREVLARYDRALFTVGETPLVTVEQAQRLCDPGRCGLDMVFSFDHMMADYGASKFDLRPLDLRKLKAIFTRWQEGLAETGWNSLYWANHDQPRAVSRFGDDGAHRVRSAKLLATALHLQRGTPYVYQGEELGMTNVPFASLDALRDVESRNFAEQALAAGGDPDAVLTQLRAASRDNARTPMHWDATPSAGFSSGRPWLATNPNYREINAAAAEADPDSVFHHYRRLVALRRSDPVVAFGAYRELLPDDESVYAFTRSHGAGTLLVLCNFSGGEARAEVPDAGRWAAAGLVLSNYGAAGAPVVEGGDFRLRPWEAVVLRRSSLGVTSRSGT